MAHKREKAINKIAHKEAQILDLLDNDLKSAIINIFKDLKKAMFKELQEGM